MIKIHIFCQILFYVIAFYDLFSLYQNSQKVIEFLK